MLITQDTEIEKSANDINDGMGDQVLSRQDVRHTYAGLYPLIDDDIDPKVYQGTGNYQVIDHEQKDGIPGLVTVFGAKFTTARLLAERTLNLIATKFQKPLRPCSTKNSIRDWINQ